MAKIPARPDPDNAAKQGGSPNDPAPPPYEQMLSESRAIENVLACLGRNASDEDVQRCLVERGLNISLEDIRKVKAELAAEATYKPPT
jgi:hypothetical protein